MKLKLMLSALLFCSSLSLAAEGDLTTAPTAPKKKPSKVLTPALGNTPRADEAPLGGLGTAGTSTARPKKMRGTTTAPEK